VQADTSQSLAARVDELMHQAKLDRKEALKLAAKERGIPKRDAYKQMLDQSDGPE
jgi:16S rRNA C1402 (ribose-2'-O) methylase RsmI